MFGDERDVTFIRLHALVQRGYRARLGDTTTPEAIWLNHPGKAPELILYPSGLVVGMPPGSVVAQGLRIESDDVEGFNRLMREVRTPTLSQRTADARMKITVFGIFFVFLFVCVYLGNLLFDMALGL